MKKQIIVLALLLISTAHISYAQLQKMRHLSELINKEDPGWPLVKQWISEAKNEVVILPKDTSRANDALIAAQVTTRSPMGAIIYETGGILVDKGWIRILGSGSVKMNRGLMEWNKGKTFDVLGDKIPFLLVADDVLGGFFAINGGGLGQEDIGKVFYFAPDSLNWESTGRGYSDFLIFCFSGDLEKYYKSLRWKGWEKEVGALDGDKGINCYPFLFTKEGKDLNKVSRRAVPIQELWLLHNGFKKQLDK